MRRPEENLHNLAKAKGVKVNELNALVLDRPRHAELIAAIRKTGAGVRLISDGDVAGVIFTTKPAETGIDIYLGIGAAPEGVLAAGALRCIGGQMQARLILDTEEKRSRALQMGVTDPNRKYDMTDLARGDVIVAATGVTDGALTRGRPFRQGSDHHRDGGLPLRHRHRAPHLRRAPRTGEVPPGLAFQAHTTIHIASWPGSSRPSTF